MIDCVLHLRGRAPLAKKPMQLGHAWLTAEEGVVVEARGRVFIAVKEVILSQPAPFGQKE